MTIKASSSAKTGATIGAITKITTSFADLYKPLLTNKDGVFLKTGYMMHSERQTYPEAFNILAKPAFTDVFTGVVDYNSDGGNVTQSSINTTYDYNRILVGPNNTLFVSYAAVASGTSINRFVMSTDSGATWKTISRSDNPGLNDVSMIATDGQVVLAIRNDLSNGWRSVDGGKTWNTFSFATGAGSLHFGNGRFVAIDSYTSAPKVRVSTDSGQTWNSITPTNIGSYSKLTFSGGKFINFGAMSANGTLRVSDDGVNYTTLIAFHTASGLSNVHFIDSFYYARHTDGLYKSDGVQAWVKVLDAGTQSASHSLIKHANVLYATTNTGIYRSTDGGNSFSLFLSSGTDTMRNIEVTSHRFIYFMTRNNITSPYFTFHDAIGIPFKPTQSDNLIVEYLRIK